VPATTVKELIAHAKARPGKLRYGSGGTGSPPHLSFEMFRTMAGIEVLHVPYKGVTPAMTDTVANEVQAIISVVPAILPTIKAGRLRALGVTSAKRAPLVPDVPTIAETVPGYEFIGWYSLAAPANTPAAVLDKINAELAQALKTSEFRDRLSALGAVPLGSTRAELATYIREQSAKMAAVVKASGARPE
jgi:tripartite-type tricarboxylate transporter receptor subunit TctC